MTAPSPPPTAASTMMPARVHGPELDQAAFACIAAIAHREAGLHISPGKSAMVRTRLARRLRALKLPDFETYCALVQSPAGGEELGAMISALTTNVSHFFREDHHFSILREKVLPGLVDKAKSRQRVRIWSAGCSNGQEPYSIAMTLREAGMPSDADLRILASDIDPMVVAHAQVGRYPETMMSGLPDPLRAKYFTADGDTPEPSWQVRPEIRRMIAFRILNLLRDWPMQGQFDAIFCRNVVIYFDADTQSRLWQRFADALEPGGWLFIGHSERISDAGLSVFESRGMTSYQRTGKSARGTAPTPTTLRD